MATMEKPKYRQSKKKTKNKKPPEAYDSDFKPSSSNTLEASCFHSTLENVEHELSEALKDIKNEMPGSQVLSDTEDTPLLTGNQPESSNAHNVRDEEALLLASSCNDSPIHPPVSAQLHPPEAQTDEVAEVDLIQMHSPVHKTTVPSSHISESRFVQDQEHSKYLVEDPYHDLLGQVEVLRVSGDQEELKAMKSSAPVDSPFVKLLGVQENKDMRQIPHTPQVACIEEDGRDQESNGWALKPFSESQLSALYSNRELESCAEFVTHFVESHLRPGSKQTHPLHELLVTYLRAINRLVVNSMDLDAMKKEGREEQSQLWILETSTVSESGECQDGNPVTASHMYQISRLNRHTLSQLSRRLAGMRELVNVTHSLDAYLCEAARLQIENLVQSVASSCPEFLNLSPCADVVLKEGPHSPSLMQSVLEVRTCIAILFSFQRRPMRDERFVRDTQDWLARLVAVLLRVGNWQDHMFLLNHVLRCPAGVGQWAASFIQTPKRPYCAPDAVENKTCISCTYLDHMIAILATIILPIRERAAFLEQFRASLGELSGTTDAWIVIDSDGEDDGCEGENSIALRENDLVAFLNQVAMGEMFRQVLGVVQRDGCDVWTGIAASPQYLLRLLAFGTVVVRLLRRGLEALAAPRYRQLSKRLGRLVRHTVQYVTDVWQIIRDMNLYETDPPLWMRLQVEYDAFLVRATNCIHSSRHLGAWQFLAILPYGTISLGTLWQLWFALHEDEQNEESIINAEQNLNWESRVYQPALRAQLEERLVSMPDAESYYLLTTFANMALARPNEDWLFIRAAALDLLQIGFFSSISQETCSKSVRILLAGLVAKHPPLISEIIGRLSEKFSATGKLSLYLFRELPLDRWQPVRSDMAILSQWLLRFSLTSPENALARYILINLNWGLDVDGPTPGELCLVPQFHRDVAILIVKAAFQYVPDGGNASTVITESVKQVSSMIRAQTPEQAFLQWVWDLLSKLRLHLLDQSDSTVWTAMANQAEVLGLVPDLDHESMVDISAALKQGHPAASYAAVAITNIGHSVPLICTQGFQCMHQLILCGHYEATLTLLHHTVPLFLDCVPSLLQTEKFLSIVSGLLQADRTYMKMAKNLISPEFSGPILRQFGDMIQSHLEHYLRYSQPGSASFVALWLRVLSHVPEWPRDVNVVYLVDIVMRTAFFDPEAKQTAISILRELFQNGTGSRQGGALSSIMSWVSGNSIGSPLLPGISCPEGPWFAFFALEIEQEEFQEKTGLWKEVLRELAAMTGKPSVDSAVKKAANTLKRPAPHANMLSIYRWSQQALDTAVDHPLLPLFWQKFFLQFLARVPSPGGQNLGSVGPKFFEGMINLVYLKRIKKKLQDCKEYYWSAVDDCKADESERRIWLENTARMIWTMGVWLEEPRLHEASLYLPALPPLYNAEKLSQVLMGDKNLWLELLDHSSVRVAQSDSVRNWEKTRSRAPRPSSPTSSIRHLMSFSSHSRDEGINPIERILKRLQSYDAPEPPPALKRFKAVLAPVRREMLQSQNATLDALRDALRIILEYAQLYALRMSEHTALDCSFLEMVPSLYRDVETEVTLQSTCQSEGYSNNHHNTVTCAGPATIRIKVREARVNESTEHTITQNRSDCDAIISRAMQPPPLKVCASSVQIEHTIKLLANEYTSRRHLSLDDAQAALRLRTVGVELFYHLVSRYNEDLALYPPTKQLLTSCLEILGQVFISGEACECERLLACMVQHPRLAGLLGPHFTPTVAASPVFLIMYQSVVDVATHPNVDLSFVLLSKFDISQWLSESKPKLSERSQFIDHLSKAFTAMGPTPPEDKLILHEMFCNHLRLVLKHDFPEHYGEVVAFLLKTSESQSLSVDVWYTVINVLLSLGVPQAGPHASPTLKIRADMNPGRVMEEIRQYAANQKLLELQELRDTATYLASHFNRERLQYGLYGLYPKYRAYVEPLAVFLGMIGHSLVVHTLQNGRGMISNKICEQLWPGLSAMFFPWIAPYWTDQLTEPTSAWIQQLTDDRSVLPPWIVGDAQHAQRIMGTFVEVMRFVLDTLPASSNLLGFLWQFYVSHFAHTAIKEHTLMVVHTNLLTLPWMRFWPAPSHLDLMLKVVDQYLPDCHAFLGAIFIEVAWGKWLAHISTSQPPPVVVRVHTCLLHLLIKLANEPTVRQSGKILSLLVEGRRLAWHLLDSQAYEPVINWYVMSVDPRAVLRLEDQEGNTIDTAVIQLLQVAAGYVPNAVQFHATTLRKRQMFVRAGIKVLVTCASRYKTLLDSNKEEFQEAIQRMLDDIETVVVGTVPQQQQVSEGGLLLMELLSAVNQPVGSTLGALALGSCVSWLKSLGSGINKSSGANTTQYGSRVVVPALLKVVGTTVNDSTALGTLLEAALEAYFCYADKDGKANWKNAVSTLQPTMPRQPPTEDTLISSGHLLSLYGLLLLQLESCCDIREEAILLNSLMTWLSAVHPGELLEAKLPLLWCQVLRLAHRQVSMSGDRITAAACLRHIVSHAGSVAEHKGGGWGLLGAIGLGKQLSVSPRCRLLCRFLCAFVSAQLPECKTDYNLVRAAPNAPGSLTQGPHSRSDPSLDAHPNAEAIKNLSILEGLLSNKIYAGMRSCIEAAITFVRNPENSLHNAEDILRILARQLYSERYLHLCYEDEKEGQGPSQTEVHTSV